MLLYSHKAIILALNHGKLSVKGDIDNENLMAHRNLQSHIQMYDIIFFSDILIGSLSVSQVC